MTALASLLLVLSPILGLIRTRERRRCLFAINRWQAGLCPVCKYPRSGEASICPECGRDMTVQYRHALARLSRPARASEATGA